MASNADAVRMVKDYVDAAVARVTAAIAEAIAEHEAKAESETFGNSHVKE